MNDRLHSELLEQLSALPAEDRRRVLDFARSLVASSPRGVAGKDLLRFAGAISHEDL